MALLATAFVVARYFDGQPFAVEGATSQRQSDLVAVYWTGDMGARVGIGPGIIRGMREHGIAVVTASSPALFGRQRSAAYADQVMERSLRLALSQPGARRLAVVASSFGSDMVVASLGHVSPDLRSKIVSVVLIGPGTAIYFHANPSGLFYRGPSQIDPAKAAQLLRGLPVTCVYGIKDRSTLCQKPAMDGAKRITINDGHLMLHSHHLVAVVVLDAIKRSAT